MKPIVKFSIVLIASAIFSTACSSSLQSQQDSAEVQKQKARQAQQELARDIQKMK